MSKWTTRMASWAEATMALCLGVMALAVFVNVVLRYGFGSSIPASEELSRLLFVWMVFIGATLAYPKGELMAFTMLIDALKAHPLWIKVLTAWIRLLVILTCVLIGAGAYQQVVVGWDSQSVVMKYPVALLPLPALLSAVSIGLMALYQLVTGSPIHQRPIQEDIDA